MIEMRDTMRKKVILTIFIIMVLLGAVVIWFCINHTEGNEQHAKPTDIIALLQMTCMHELDSGLIIRREYFIIRNSPDSLVELKAMIEGYNLGNPIAAADNGENRIWRTFLRESEFSNKQWWQSLKLVQSPPAVRPDAYIEDNRAVDAIAYVCWEYNVETGEFEVTLYSYSDRKEDGEIIKEINWSKNN